MANKLGAQLFISRLSFYTTNNDLHKLFLPFGAIKEAYLVKDYVTERSKGFGFVTFELETDAHKPLKAMNNRIVDGRLIFVELAKTTKPAEHDTRSG